MLLPVLTKVGAECKYSPVKGHDRSTDSCWIFKSQSGHNLSLIIVFQLKKMTEIDKHTNKTVQFDSYELIG